MCSSPLPRASRTTLQAKRFGLWGSRSRTEAIPEPVKRLHVLPHYGAPNPKLCSRPPWGEQTAHAPSLRGSQAVTAASQSLLIIKQHFSLLSQHRLRRALCASPRAAMADAIASIANAKSFSGAWDAAAIVSAEGATADGQVRAPARPPSKRCTPQAAPAARPRLQRPPSEGASVGACGWGVQSTSAEGSCQARGEGVRRVPRRVCPSRQSRRAVLESRRCRLAVRHLAEWKARRDGSTEERAEATAAIPIGARCRRGRAR